MDFPGFEFLKDAFNKFAAIYPGDDVSARAARSLAAGAKATVDQAMVEYPKEYIAAFVQDVYNTLTSQDVADGVSLAVRSIDEETVRATLGAAVESLDNDETALKVAQGLKSVAQKVTTEDLQAAFSRLAEMQPEMTDILSQVQMFALTVAHVYRTGSDAEIVDLTRQLASQLPTDAIAAQIGALTSAVTPEVVQAKAAEIVKQLPSAETIADIAHGVGAVASKQFGEASKAATSAEIKDAVATLAVDAAAVVTGTLANDNAQKKPAPRKKGGSFNL